MLIQHLEILLGYLFFPSRNDGNEPTRNSFGKYYTLLVEIKDFNALIQNKPFFAQPVKK